MSQVIDEAAFGPISGGFRNMFIMRKEDFFAYCEWIFNILFKLYEHIKTLELDTDEKRNIGWSAEWLSSIYFFYLAKKRSHLEVPYFELHLDRKVSLITYLKALIYVKIKRNKVKYISRIFRYKFQNCNYAK